MRSRQLYLNVLLAVILFLAIVLILGLVETAGAQSCSPALEQLRPTEFLRWFGCALAVHENLASGLIAAAGALFSARIAWQSIMRQINTEADQAYDALRVELGSVIDMLNLYWRVVDAAIKNKDWRENGIALLRSMYPRPNDLVQSITTSPLVGGLDPARRRQFHDLKNKLSMLADTMHRRDAERLGLENIRTMLTHTYVSLRTFDLLLRRG